MYEIFIGIGIVISLIYNELTDWSPGGLITPGYIALFIDQPIRILITLCVAITTYVLVLLIQKLLPIFGKRRFAVCVVIAMTLKYAVSGIGILDSSVLLNSIGVIIPGLISNDMLKQGVSKTLLSLMVVTGGLFGILVLMKGMM